MPSRASTDVEVGGVYYRLDETTLTASVQCRPYEGETSQDAWMFYQASELYVGRTEIPESVTCDGQAYAVVKIEPYAFAGSKLMTALVVPKTVTTIGEGAFSLCNGLQSITVADENPNFFSLQGVMYARGATPQFYVVPRAISSVTQFPSGLTTVPSSAFQYCQYLTTLTLPEGITTLQDGAFNSCKSLQSITLPTTLTRVERDAFSACSSLTSITCLSTTPPSLVSPTTTFSGMPSSAVLTVPQGCVSAYQTANGWSGFDIRETSTEEEAYEYYDARAGEQAWAALCQTSATGSEYVARSTPLGQYATLCLPYECLYQGVTLYNVVGKITDDEGRATHIALVPETSEVLWGGTPYVYLATAATQTFTRWDMSDDGTDLPLPEYGFDGTYISLALSADNHVLQNGAFRPAQTNETCNPLECFLTSLDDVPDFDTSTPGDNVLMLPVGTAPSPTAVTLADIHTLLALLLEAQTTTDTTPYDYHSDGTLTILDLAKGIELLTGQ